MAEPTDDLPNLPLLIKLLKMTTSSNDREVVVAIRKANEQLKKFGGDWERLLSGKVTIIADPFANVAPPRDEDVRRHPNRAPPPPPRPQPQPQPAAPRPRPRPYSPPPPPPNFGAKPQPAQKVQPSVDVSELQRRAAAFKRQAQRAAAAGSQSTDDLA